VHDTVTPVMVAVLEPPPHDTIPRSDNKAKIRARVRKPIPQTLRAQHPFCKWISYDKPLAWTRRQWLCFVRRRARTGGCPAVLQHFHFCPVRSETSRRIRIQASELAQELRARRL